MKTGMTVKTHLLRTASEIAMGRPMRAPDHATADGGGSAAPVSEAAPAAEGGGEGGAEGVLELQPEQIVDEATDDFSAFERAGKHGEVDTPAPGADAPEGGDAPKPGEEGYVEPEGDKPKGEEEPKGKTAQKRIDELTATARAAERRVAELERALETRGDAPEGKKADGDAEASGEPDPADYEYGEADAGFIKDSARYHARAEFTQLENVRRLESEFTEIESGYSARVEKAVERYPDFEEKVVKGAETESWKATPVMALAMKTSEEGPDVAYYLATNPAESERIAKLSPLEQAREMGRLEGKFAFAEKPKPKAVTGAPKPLESGTKGGGARVDVDEATEDFAAFEADADKRIRR